MKKSGNFYIEEAESDFKKVHKSIIQDKDIDCLTLGIYVKILVLGKTWQLNIKGLSSYFGISDMKIRRSISLLEKKGYIARKPIQEETTGKLAGWDYIVYAKPINQEERTNAGVKTVYPENRQHGYPTTRLSDNTETGGLLNNRLKEDIDLKEYNKLEEQKEEKDKSFSKKDDFPSLAAESQAEYEKPKTKKQIAQEIADFWNENKPTNLSEVEAINQDRINSIQARLNSGYTVDDIKKAILLCNSLPDFYLGKEKGKPWKANFDWLIKNRNGNFVLILEGALHTTDEQKREYEHIINAKSLDEIKYTYRPEVDGFNMHWNEPNQCYITYGDIKDLKDGYTKDNRPNGAKVIQNGCIFVWSSERKEWVKQD